MNDLIFLIPLIVGFGVMALGFKLQIPKGPGMNRSAFGMALVVGSFFWWLSGAILLAYEGKFYFIQNMLTVLAFFVGIAFLFPNSPDATRPNQHSLPGLILVWAGFILGFAHSLALMFTAYWPARLLEFYAALGLHGAPTPTQ
jgi:hypothetical protein